ncbi:hypothetical protein E2C01_041474 [Portunus trituberculatus]|uniref:Uncharacterized protein n=1 Tax=Portunus trituberculatus TaxID=210409 RepID=A0A5B7FR17_PORTR|nr:hypothetical protein [Portunus trituberculatus]
MPRVPYSPPAFHSLSQHSPTSHSLPQLLPYLIQPLPLSTAPPHPPTAFLIPNTASPSILQPPTASPQPPIVSDIRITASPSILQPLTASHSFCHTYYSLSQHSPALHSLPEPLAWLLPASPHLVQPLPAFSSLPQLPIVSAMASIHLPYLLQLLLAFSSLPTACHSLSKPLSASHSLLYGFW